MTDLMCDGMELVEMMDLEDSKKEVHCHPSKAGGLLELPEEVVLDVMHLLPLNCLLSCTEVSWQMYRMAKDPTIWRGLFVERPTTENSPSPRLWSSSVVFNGKMYLFGGHTTQGVSNLIGNVKNDLYCYDFKDETWSLIPHQMSGKTEHKCVQYNNLLYFVGGYNGYDYTNDIFVFDPSNNTSSVLETFGTPFSRRSAATAVVHKNKMYVFGGWNGFTKTWFNDLFEFDFITRTWRQIEAKGQIPKQRTSHAAVVYKDSMYVFAGFSGDTYLSDVHEYNFATETWTDISPFTSGDQPGPRSRFCTVVRGEYMYLLGGWNKVNYFNDFFMYHFETKTWTKIQGKFDIPGISQYSLTCHEDFLYVFGGFCAKEKTCVNKMYVCHLDHRGAAAC